MSNPTSQAERLNGFNLPRVWGIMNSLAIQTNSINLGQGFPSWQPPSFFMKNLEESQNYSTHQYSNAFGSPQYRRAIAKFHQQTFKGHQIENNIIGTNGGSQALFCIIMGHVNPGDEVIIFDPAYDVYRPQVQMAGGKTIGITLRPTKRHSKAELLQRLSKNEIYSSEQDQWDFDFNQFQSALNEKTKILIITTPHNPVGKVFTQKELARIAQVVKKYPQLIIIEDNVYEGMTFDQMLGKPLPKIINEPDMYDKTLTVYSGGKIFQATGIRCGWVIGPSHLLKPVKAIFQQTCFCQYNVVENAVAKSLLEISHPDNTYLMDYAKDIIAKRNLLAKRLAQSSFDFDLWIPKGSHFITADISRVEVKEKYYTDEKGNTRTKDYAFAYQLALENGVICIPCSPFFDKNSVKYGQNFVRFAFCKDEGLINEAGNRMK